MRTAYAPGAKATEEHQYSWGYFAQQLREAGEDVPDELAFLEMLANMRRTNLN